MTETTGLLTALLAVQSEAKTLPKDGRNPAFGGSRYTKLDTIVELLGPILARHELVWTTMPCRDAHGEPALRYQLAHAPTGQTLEDTMPLLPVKADPQGMGSAITYARRYSLCAVLNLVADEDDDGNAGSQGGDQAGRPETGRAGVNGSGKPTEKQKALLKRLIAEKQVTVDQLLTMLSDLGYTGEIEEGWVDRLSGGRDGQVSALIDRLMAGNLPSHETADTPRSDVPADGDFTHPAAGDTSDVPFGEAA